MNAAIEFDIRDGVAWIALNRPYKLNAINEDVLNGLLQSIARVGSDESVGAVVLHGRGRAFSAGGDISAMSGMDEGRFAQTIDLYMQLAKKFRACRKPILAAVHGYALAGGFELALICDIRIAAAGTLFGLPDTPLGLSPTSGMTYLLPRIVGLGRALDLAFSAENIDAEEARRIGLVTRVVHAEQLLAEAERIARRISSFPRVGVAFTKDEFYGALEMDFEHASTVEHTREIACFQNPEVKARMKAFTDRKKR